MMRQYEEMISLIDIEIREEDRKASKRYIYTMNGFKVAVVLPYILILLFPSINAMSNYVLGSVYNEFEKLMLILVLLDLTLYLYSRLRYVKKTRGMLQSQCDPEHMISWCGAMQAYVRREKNWGEHFYNIGCAFYYVGRIEDAKKVVYLMDKYHKTNRDLFLRRLLSAHINFYEKNQEELQRDCETLTYLSKTVKMNKQMKFFLNAALSQFAFLNLEQEGRYDEVYGMYQSSYSYYHSMLVEVMKNYYMYQAAKHMGNSELAETHRQFVLKNGGTLWYKADLENECR